jgi:glycosyltransferase involved in cell wall biosynthesis
LRVAYVVDEWVTLSQTFIREEIAELRRQGVHVELVALEHGDTAPGADGPALVLADRLAASSVARLWSLARRPGAALRLRRVQARMRPERIRYRTTLPAVADELRSGEVQWVHAHFGWEAAGVAEALAALLGLGWSFTAHANDIFVANEHLAGKLARADRLVTVCQYNLDHLHATYPRLPPTDVIVCGVELPQAVERRTPEVDVLAVGRLVPKKGFDLLVRAAADLHAAHPDLRVEIVGDGPERAALQALAEDLGVGAAVHLLGPHEHAWVLERMASASIVCLPARIAADGDRDSMPVVLKEAMARAVPVVATAVVAIPEMVDDDVGRLVPPDDGGALASALHELLLDPSLRALLGDAARERVAAHFTLAGEVSRLRGLFEGWRQGH